MRSSSGVDVQCWIVDCHFVLYFLDVKMSDCGNTQKRKSSTTILSFFNKKKPIDSGNLLKQSSEVAPTECIIQTHSESELNADCMPNDIGKFVNRKINAVDRRKVLFEIWNPDISFKFPGSGKRNLKFQISWLNRWKWLSYSQMEDGAFCKYCVIFSTDGAGRGQQPLGKLVKSKFNKWKDAVCDFNNHEKSAYHSASVIRAAEFVSVYEKEKDPIDVQINEGLKKQIEDNRSKLFPIIETIIMCGRQGIALRGHRDAGPIDVAVEPLENDGNFRTLLRFKAKGGDKDLENHLNFCNKNSMYISPQTQNEVIGVCNDLILNVILNKVKQAKFFSVLVDETTDIQGIEQCSICVRYIDMVTKSIKEDFLHFVPVKDVTGKGLAGIILEQLKNMGLDLMNLRGQGYDGAASMSGKYNGVQAHIRDKYPLALYTHCCSHSLNLAVTDACSVQTIKNCMGTISNICTFFKYPKRLNAFHDSIEKKIPDTRKTRLKSLCPTRWVERHDAVLVFLELFDAIVDSLEIISEWPDRVASSNAQQFICAVNHPEFLISIHVLGKVLSFSLPLSRYLQTENLDIISAVESASLLEDKLNSLRKNAVETFHSVFEEAATTAKDFNVSISIPRRRFRPTEENVTNNSPEEYFRKSIFIPFVDSFIMQLKERFLSHKAILTSFSCLLPQNKSEPNTDDEECMKMLIKKYSTDCACSDQSALGELSMWYSFFARKLSTRDIRNPLEALGVCNENEFPTVHSLLRILVTLPVTTAANERSFSTLKRLKSYLRNTTGENRLNGLALMNIYRDIPIEPKDVLNEFAKQKRKLEFRL